MLCQEDNATANTTDLWHVRKWQISLEIWKDSFLKGREGAEPGCEIETSYKFWRGGEGFFIPDLAVGQVSFVHMIYIYNFLVLSQYPISG